MTQANKRVRISGMGYCVPDRVVTNHELSARMNTSDAFIVSRAGIVERRHVAPGEATSDLMITATRRAVANAGLRPEDIDMMIVSTLSPDHHDPSQANRIQPALGLRHIPCFDIRAQCSGFLFGSDIALQYLRNGACSNVLVVCGEVLSKRIDPSDEGRNLAILLGDGAAAAVLSASEDGQKGFIDLLSGADGTHFHDLWTRAPGTANPSFSKPEDASAFEFRMLGKPLAAHAVEKLSGSAREILARNGLSVADVDLVVSHQPNLRMLDALRDVLALPQEKLMVTVDRLGNMASASLPVSIAMALESGRLRPGMLALFLTYGAGSTWSAALYRC
jgi:3-oxoacyl-[acyl-carrier-protein] synthase III